MWSKFIRHILLYFTVHSSLLPKISRNDTHPLLTGSQEEAKFDSFISVEEHDNTLFYIPFKWRKKTCHYVGRAGRVGPARNHCTAQKGHAKKVQSQAVTALTAFRTSNASKEHERERERRGPSQGKKKDRDRRWAALIGFLGKAWHDVAKWRERSSITSSRREGATSIKDICTDSCHIGTEVAAQFQHN